MEINQIVDKLLERGMTLEEIYKKANASMGSSKVQFTKMQQIALEALARMIALEQPVRYEWKPVTHAGGGIKWEKGSISDDITGHFTS